MSVRELHEWYEYYSQEPFLADRLEQQLATLSTMVGSFGGSKLKPNDFMIRKLEEKKLSNKEFENNLKAMFAGFAKKG